MIDPMSQGMLNGEVPAKIASGSLPQVIHKVANNGTNEQGAADNSQSLPVHRANESSVRKLENLLDTLFSRKDFSWLQESSLPVPEEMLRTLADLSRQFTAMGGGDTRSQVFIQLGLLVGVLVQQVASLVVGRTGQNALSVLSQPMAHEQYDLEAIRDEAKAMMNGLKVFVLMGDEWQNGSISMTQMLKNLKKRRSAEKLKVRIPAGSSGMHDLHATKLPWLFKRCFRVGEGEKLELFKRKGDKPAIIDDNHQDRRPIIGLTDVGKRAWMLAARFLAKHDTSGPWAKLLADRTAEMDPPGR